MISHVGKRGSTAQCYTEQLMLVVPTKAILSLKMVLEMISFRTTDVHNHSSPRSISYHGNFEAHSQLS